MVEQIKHINAKLKFASFPNGEETAERQIHLRKPKARYVVAAFCSLSHCGRSNKRNRIQGSASRGASGFEPEGLARHQVRARNGVAARGEAKDSGVKRESAS